MEGIITTPMSPGVSPVQLGDCIDDLLNFVLKSSVDGNLGVDIGLPNDYCSQLLKDDTSDHEHFPSVETSGVPSNPLYKHLASVLHKSIADGFIQKTSEEVPHIHQDSSLRSAEEKWNKLILEKGSQLRHMLKNISFELNVQEPYFSQLKDGLKTVEGRCAVGHYNRIGQGSSLFFNKCLMLEVQDVHHYASFSEMLEGECLNKILPGVENIEEGIQIYRNFYTAEKERVNGVLAICLSRPVSQPYILLAEIISGLSYEGIQSLLGLKHTAGTVADALPPSRSVLFSSFTARHNPNVKGCTLTEGARALAKHAVRSSSTYWGTLEGSDSTKNRLAMDVIMRLIAHSCWLNLHIVPPHGAVFEIRVAEGYGARWSSDGAKFIGFLEPYTEDGHAKRWRH